MWPLPIDVPIGAETRGVHPPPPTSASAGRCPRSTPTWPPARPRRAAGVPVRRLGLGDSSQRTTRPCTGGAWSTATAATSLAYIELVGAAGLDSRPRPGLAALLEAGATHVVVHGEAYRRRQAARPAAWLIAQGARLVATTDGIACTSPASGRSAAFPGRADAAILIWHTRCKRCLRGVSSLWAQKSLWSLYAAPRGTRLARRAVRGPGHGALPVRAGPRRGLHISGAERSAPRSRRTRWSPGSSPRSVPPPRSCPQSCRDRLRRVPPPVVRPPGRRHVHRDLPRAGARTLDPPAVLPRVTPRAAHAATRVASLVCRRGNRARPGTYTAVASGLSGRGSRSTHARVHVVARAPGSSHRPRALAW